PAQLTVIFHKEICYLFFEFRYNAARIADHVEVARQFLEMAEFGASRGYTDSVVEVLFEAVELLAKAFLMLLPDPEVVRTKKHNFIRSRLHQHTARQSTGTSY